MHSLRDKLIVVLAVGVLAVIGSFMSSRQVSAQGSTDGLSVRVISPLPLPVTGLTTVSGTLAATQSGPWNVSLLGIPKVQNRDEPARQPLTISLKVFPGDFTELASAAGVSVGKRYVVEQASAACTSTVPPMVVIGFVQNTNVPPFFNRKGLLVPSIVSSQSQYYLSGGTRMYVDPTDAFEVILRSTDIAAQCEVYFVGYTVDLP